MRPGPLLSRSRAGGVVTALAPLTPVQVSPGHTVLPSGHVVCHSGAVSDTDPAQVPIPTRGRGQVIAGAILVMFYIVPTVVWLVGLGWALIRQQELPIQFLIWFFALVLMTPIWVVGIALLGVGRSKQRGRVRGAIVAWILAVGGLPGIIILIAVGNWAGSSGGTAGTGIALAIILSGIPVLSVLALASGAWLVWGRPPAIH